ncbi:(Fe-S)-binding protein [Flaviaesturariibacter flavus]|uniref:(Fe-S)-binding protein n=1 Tax=Flaviaesturariibacter flavus TaxID=2502780 RepID=A0A4R1BNX1_9BACT|nr:(Fe-S)-binding protein [Flaviaesturariibacter flavus]TCJ19264.1 (Fe-S)-binding protein [Flaviaesturariibacter flavus]
MQLVQQILFVILAATAVWVFARKVGAIRRNINLGRDEELKDNPGARWRNTLLMAFGQKRMFDKPLVGLLHFLVYAGFVIINIEILEIILDGILGSHRLFAPTLGTFYTFVINFFEILAFLVLASCVVFLLRRNVVRVKRLNMPELNGWPRSDANFILSWEILLMSLFLVMNAADKALQLRGYGHYGEVQTADFWVSGIITPIFAGFNTSTLVGVERSAWWLHIAGIFVFLNYLPYSKHLHIILAFPNTYFARLKPQAEMTNMPEIQQEVLYAMQPELAPTGDAAAEGHKRFGAKDVADLSWKNLLDAYTCTECGRCSQACPATQTGKKLSPRKIMMDTRDRMEEIGVAREKNGGTIQEDGKTLLHDYITTEELWACTSCQACVQACPVLINPLSIINQLKRYLALEESNQPSEWNGMYSNVENNFAPWKFSPDDRANWALELNEEGS